MILLIYLESARENGIEGTVVLKLIVEADGSVSTIRVMRDLAGGCTEEAIRVVKLMPQWIPGEQNQIKVRASFILPVKFKLT